MCCAWTLTTILPMPRLILADARLLMLLWEEEEEEKNEYEYGMLLLHFDNYVYLCGARMYTSSVWTVQLTMGDHKSIFFDQTQAKRTHL